MPKSFFKGIWLFCFLVEPTVLLNPDTELIRALTELKSIPDYHLVINIIYIDQVHCLTRESQY